MKNNPILYILMRNDLQSLNPGKAMAQASHATNLFMLDKNPAVQLLRKEWTKTTTQGFGTVLVLAASLSQIKTAVKAAMKVSGMFPTCGGLVVDPTYPYSVSAETAELIPITHDTLPRIISGQTASLWRQDITCGYVFGDKGDLRTVIGNLPLHP